MKQAATIAFLLIVTIASVSAINLYIKEYYPKTNHYVFVCETPGETPSGYTWYYGDGHKLINIKNGDTYHIYEENGAYTVSCTNVDTGETAKLRINVEGGTAGSGDNGGGNGGGDDDDDGSVSPDSPEGRRHRRSNGGYLLIVGGKVYVRPTSDWALRLRSEYEGTLAISNATNSTNVTIEMPPVIEPVVEDEVQYATPVKFEVLVNGTYVPVNETQP